MVDPYAIVRRLTGCELISPKDAQQLTEAVDGLIDEIGSKDTHIAELEAEVERLARERDYWQSQHDERTRQLGQAEDEALSRTGAVKVSDMQLNTEERALANDMHALHRPEEQAVTEAMVDRFMKRMGWSDPIHEPVRPTVRAAIEAALEPAAPEGHPMPNPASIKAWRIKKGEPIPQWLQKTENVEITAGCDLIVIEDEVEGFDVYMADPNSTASMMVATRLDLGKSGHIEGAPTNLRTASVILDEFPRIGVTKARIEAVWEEISSHHPDQGSFDEDRSITRAALKAAMEAKG